MMDCVTSTLSRNIIKILLFSGYAFLKVLLFSLLFYFLVGQPKFRAGCQVLPRGIYFNLLFVPVTKGNI